jgi:hypothetical protein
MMDHVPALEGRGRGFGSPSRKAHLRGRQALCRWSPIRVEGTAPVASILDTARPAIAGPAHKQVVTARPIRQRRKLKWSESEWRSVMAAFLAAKSKCLAEKIKSPHAVKATKKQKASLD